MHEEQHHVFLSPEERKCITSQQSEIHGQNFYGAGKNLEEGINLRELQTPDTPFFHGHAPETPLMPFTNKYSPTANVMNTETTQMHFGGHWIR